MTRTMKDSGIEWIGQIPEDWKIHRNKVVFSCNKEIVGENSNNIQLLSLTTGGVKTKDINSVGGKLPESFDTYQYVAIDNIVMCLFNLDMSAVFSGISNYNGMISPAYKVLKCNNNYIIPKYADYWFKFVFVDRKFATYAKNLRYTLSYDEFGVLSIPIPSLPEQQKIADFLDEKCSHIDSILEKTKASIDECKQLKQSVITQAVTKGIRPNRPMKDSGIEWIGQIPEDWEVARMKSCIAKRDGGAWGEEANNSEGDCICLRIANFDYNKFRFSDSDDLTIRHYPLNVIEKLKLEKNDILIEKSGGGEKTPVGRTVLFDKTYTALYANFMDRLRCSNIVKPSYMQYVFVTFYKNDYARNYIKQTTGIQNLDLTSMLSKELMPLPSTSEQQKIADFLDKKCSEIDKLITKKEKLIEELETYKKSLIYEYVTGKKEVV